MFGLIFCSRERSPQVILMSIEEEEEEEKKWPSVFLQWKRGRCIDNAISATFES